MKNGFTLIELLLVIGLVASIATLTIPVSMNFYRNQLLEDTTRNILVVSRRAQIQAKSQSNNSAFGLKFFSNYYVLFQGDSYIARNQSEDEFFSLPNGVSVGGIDEIIFDEMTGMPSVGGTLTVASFKNSKKININEEGKIEEQ